MHHATMIVLAFFSFWFAAMLLFILAALRSVK